jgi:hypothetical protein
MCNLIRIILNFQSSNSESLHKEHPELKHSKALRSYETLDDKDETAAAKLVQSAYDSFFSDVFTSISSSL